MMWECAGIERDAAGLGRGLQAIAGWPARGEGAVTREAFERQQMTTVAALMLTAALRRTESRGGHYRSDFPQTDDLHWKRRQVFVRER
jgi:L-aspartate oxidase